MLFTRALKEAINNGLILKKVQSNQVQTKSMVKGIYCHEYWIKKKCEEWIWEKTL